ncbi:hypothetical protein PENTCL1PPCAC_21036, partial [Pristionchus entomophagus]
LAHSYACLKMRSILLFVVILPFIHCSCPEGYELVRDGECRGFASKIASTYADVYDRTAEKCAEVQGQPIIIHSEEQQQYWLKKREAYTSAYMVLGMRCNTTTKHAEWMDGSPVDYIPKDGGVDDMTYCYDDCSWYLWHDGHYHSLCSQIDVSADAFCTVQLQQPVASGDGCDGFGDDADDRMCYQVGTIAENWQDAQKTCKFFGGDLASVHNDKENSFIRRMAVSRGQMNGVFLGGIRFGDESDFGWVDSTTWNYANFKLGYPETGKGSCLSLDTSNTAGEWVNSECGSSHAAACVRNPKNHACPGGPWKEGQYITSPGFPFDASFPCDFQFTVAFGKRVEVEVIFLEANSCCDQLVIYDSFNGGNIVANVTGEIQNKVYKTRSSNTMKVSWMPDGGVNVRGMMITYHAV